MEKNYGLPTKYDPQFDGPVRQRTATDTEWLILYIVFLGGWVYIGCYSMTHGDLQQYLALNDSSGRKCGLDPEVKDNKYLVSFDIPCVSLDSNPCVSKKVCVDECPTETIHFLKLPLEQLIEFKNKMICTDDVILKDLGFKEILELIHQGKCASTVEKSQPVLGQCFGGLEESFTRIREKTEKYVLKTENDVHRHFMKMTARVDEAPWSSKMLNSLSRARWYLIGALFVVVVLCLCYVLLLRWIASPVVWFSISVQIALLTSVVAECFVKYSRLPSPDSKPWLIAGIVLSVVLVVWVLIILSLIDRINMTIKLIKEGSKAIFAVKSTLLLPIIPWILQCFVIVYSVAVMMHLSTIGEPVYETNLHTPCIRDDIVSCHFVGIRVGLIIHILQFLNILGFFWTIFFINGVCDMVLASVFSTWYWTFFKTDLPFSTVVAAIYRTVRYHLGTVVFGSLIIAIVRIIRIILKQLSSASRNRSIIGVIIMCLAKIILKCIEDLLRMISKNAYIVCAVYGHNFCTSMRVAFNLIMRNILRVVILDEVLTFVFFMSKLMISGVMGISVYFLLQWTMEYNINYWPAILVGVMSYIICSIFFKVYEMAVDTLFYCFLEDIERHNGTAERPYYMTKDLMKILHKSD